MAKKKASSGKAKFDFKQFMLEKGEKIAIAVAGLGLALLALMGIMQATRADSPNAITAKLKEGARNIDARLAQSPGQEPGEIKLPEGSAYEVVSAFDYRTENEWFNPAGTIIEKRVNPPILAPTEGTVTYAIGGIGVFDIQGDNIAVVENRQQAKADNRAIDRFRSKAGRAASKAGAKAPQPTQPSTPQPPTPPGAGGNTGGRGGGVQIQAGRTGEPEIQYLPIDSPQLEKAVLALNLQPIRMAVIQGVVPYKAQVEKYLRALRLDSDQTLEAEGSAPTYRGLVVERQVLAADGKTVVQDWMTFDHVKAIEDLYKVTAEFVTDEKHKDLIPDPEQQLYLKLPKFVRGMYAATNLSQVAKALDEIQKTGTTPKSLTTREKKFKELNPFNPDDINRGGGTTPGGGVGPGGIPTEVRGAQLPPNRMAGPPRGGVGGLAAQPQQRNNAAPVWIFQFIDPTIEPGHCYRYRVQLKAENPNKGKKDLVAIPSAASVDELVSDWFEIPGMVYAPPEEHLYAHGDRVKENALIGTSDFDTTVLKFHRWFDFIRVTRSSSRADPVAEWVVADIEAKRGQYVHQEKSFKVPLWSMAFGTYLFRDKINGEKPRSMAQYLKRENVRVDFSPSTPTLLVDFEGGAGMYRLPSGQNARDESVAEVLLLTDDGKAIVPMARNVSVDKENPERLAREKMWEQWLDEVENAGKAAQNQASPPPRGG
jgi:hypothetical protein